MKARDHTFKKTEYKGQYCDAADAYCPCRPCYNCHDCGYYINGKRIKSFECATRHNNGCPSPMPRPKHIFKNTKRFSNRKKGDEFTCVRCKQKVKIGYGEFDFLVSSK